MNIDQLRYFVQTYQLNSTNKAAEQAHMSPQAISASIRKLEEELGYILFCRHGKKNMTLSEHGKIFLNTAETILQTLEKGLSEMEKLNQKEEFITLPTEELSILVGPVISLGITPLVVRMFTQKHPNVTLKIMQHEVDEIFQIVLDGGVLGIVASLEQLSDTPELIYRYLAADKTYVAASVNHPLAKQKSVSFKTILKYPLAIYQSSYTQPNLICSVLEQYGKPKYHTITNNVQIYQNVIASNQAVGFINRIAIKNDTVLSNVRDSIVTIPITNMA